MFDILIRYCCLTSTLFDIFSLDINTHETSSVLVDLLTLCPLILNHVTDVSITVSCSVKLLLSSTLYVFEFHHLLYD
jgi:hypothetical protein